jgi:hypothetical protein
MTGLAVKTSLGWIFQWFVFMILFYKVKVFVGWVAAFLQPNEYLENVGLPKAAIQLTPVNLPKTNY